MSNTNELIELRVKLAELQSELLVLQKSKLWTSAQVVERRILATKNAITRAEKEQMK